MKANFLQQNTKRIIAGLLAVWLSGVVFLFCCEMPMAKAAEAESCPLAKTNHCHKKSAGADVSQFVSLQTDDRTFDCCRFPSQVFDKARKIETIQQTAAVATIVKVAPPQFSFVETNFKRREIHQSFIRNRGSTFLRNCVFRI